MKATFKTILQQAGDKDATGIHIPPEAIAQLGAGKRPKVKVSFKGYTYRNTVAVYGDVYMVGVSKEHRDASGVKGGDELEVTLELDTEPRIVEVPEDLAAALAAKPGARAAFDALAQSTRKEHVRQVESAKAAETRTRRIAGIVDKLPKT
jgi:hypothetical protein